jgi:hypothetical protein
VLPPVADTLDAPRSALRRVGTPAQARGVSFAEGVRGDAHECLTRAQRETTRAHTKFSTSKFSSEWPWIVGGCVDVRTGVLHYSSRHMYRT